MESLCYLAMMPEEFTALLPPPWKAACFPGETGRLRGEMLVLTDHTLTEGMSKRLEEASFQYLLFDLVRPPAPDSAVLVHKLAARFGEKCILPPDYALPGLPLFLPPVPPQLTPEEYLQPWHGRSLWLDVTPNQTGAVITRQGTEFVPRKENASLPFQDSNLCCHYDLLCGGEQITVPMSRTVEDTRQMLRRGIALGLLGCVGLYSEWVRSEKEGRL